MSFDKQIATNMKENEQEFLVLDPNSDVPLYLQAFLHINPNIDHKIFMESIIKKLVSAKDAVVKDEATYREVLSLYEKVVKETVLQEDRGVESIFGNFIPISTCPNDEEFDPFFHKKGIGFQPNELFEQYVIQEKFFKINNN